MQTEGHPLTRLIVRHSGDRDPATVERFKGGWLVKLDQLGRAIETRGIR